MLTCIFLHYWLAIFSTHIQIMAESGSFWFQKNHSELIDENLVINLLF